MIVHFILLILDKGVFSIIIFSSLLPKEKKKKDIYKELIFSQIKIIIAQPLPNINYK